MKKNMQNFLGKDGLLTPDSYFLHEKGTGRLPGKGDRPVLVYQNSARSRKFELDFRNIAGRNLVCQNLSCSPFKGIRC